MTDPIPVSEALSALEREIAGTYHPIHRGALEYLRFVLKELLIDTFVHPSDPIYAAVAPIVERWREEDKR